MGHRCLHLTVALLASVVFGVRPAGAGDEGVFYLAGSKQGSLQLRAYWRTPLTVSQAASRVVSYKRTGAGYKAITFRAAAVIAIADPAGNGSPLSPEAMPPAPNTGN